MNGILMVSLVSISLCKLLSFELKEVRPKGLKEI